MKTRESEPREPFAWPASSPAAPDLSSTRAIIGIDPGLSGAVVRLWKGELLAERDFKERADISRAVARLVPGCHQVWIEQVHAMPGEGVCSVWTFGQSTGTAKGAVDVCFPPGFEEVAPQRWQNFFRKLFNLPKRPFKEMTRAIAARLFPQQADLFKRKKDHGTADAALIAAYGALQGRIVAADKPNVVGNEA
jgi:crossover junction endodeoxyribonuclease RuvC